MLFGGFPLPGWTCPMPGFPTKTPFPAAKGIPLPVPGTFGKPLGTPVAFPWTAPVGVPLPVPTAPFVSPSTYPFAVPGFGKGFPFPAAPVAKSFGIPFAPGVPGIFGVPFCA